MCYLCVLNLLFKQIYVGANAFLREQDLNEGNHKEVGPTS